MLLSEKFWVWDLQNSKTYFGLILENSGIANQAFNWKQNYSFVQKRNRYPQTDYIYNAWKINSIKYIKWILQLYTKNSLYSYGRVYT